MSRHFKVVDANLSERCLKLRKAGMTQIEIAALLSAESDIELNQVNIHNFLSSFNKKLRDAIRNVDELAERAAAQELDLNDELLFANKKAHILYDRYEQGDDEISPMSVLHFLQRQIEFMAKRLGEISDAPQVNIMVNEFNSFKILIYEVLREVGGSELEQRFVDALGTRYDKMVAGA